MGESDKNLILDQIIKLTNLIAELEKQTNREGKPLPLTTQMMERQTQSISQEVTDLLVRGDEIIKQAEALLIQKNGVAYSLSEWITIKEYAKHFGVKSTNVVSNWIARGIIPEANILDIPELNNIRLIKAVPYHE